MNFISTFDELNKLYEAKSEEIEEPKKELTESVDLSKYRVVLADYNDDDGYDVEDIEYLLKPGQTKGDLVVHLSYQAGFMYIYVHDEREATPEEVKALSHYTFDTIEGEDYRDYGEVDEEDWLKETYVKEEASKATRKNSMREGVFSDEDGWKTPSSTALAAWLTEWDFTYDAETDTYLNIWNRAGETYDDLYADLDYYEAHSCTVEVAEKGSIVEVTLDSMFTNGPKAISQTFKNNDATIVADIEKFIDENQEKLWMASESIGEACNKKELTEDEEIEIVDDEASVEEMPSEEPKQTIIECSKCGALVIVDEVEIDEESDLVNIKDECKFCEEKEGFKIVGAVVPYEAVEVEEPVEEEPVEDEVADDDLIEEGLADVARKVFDKPASIETQQAWEDELNGEMGEISPKRRAELEKKFAQQRDWEARHPEK
jgi:hypothetical protein